MEKEKLVKALENYFEDCKFRKRLNNKTIKAYKIDLNQFFEIVNNLDDEVKEINEYIHFLNKKYSKHKTVKRKLASVKAFYSYLEYEEIIEYSPFNKVKKNKRTTCVTKNNSKRKYRENYSIFI